MRKPFDGNYTITNPFGRWYRVGVRLLRHNGIDWAMPRGVEAKAVEDGNVSFAGWMRDFGNCVWINHGKGVVTIYAHLQDISVRYGQIVRERQVLGHTDNTGLSTGNHIHHEIRVNGSAVDPANFNWDGYFPAPSSPQPPATKRTATVTSGIGANIRDRATSQGRKIGGYGYGTTFTVLETTAGENYQGNNLWLRSDKGWIWSGGTNYRP